MTILKRGGSVPMGVEGDRDRWFQTTSIQREGPARLLGVSTEGSLCKEVTKEKDDFGQEATDLAFGSIGELHSCSEKSSATIVLGLASDLEDDEVALADTHVDIQGVHLPIVTEASSEELGHVSGTVMANDQVR